MGRPSNQCANGVRGTLGSDLPNIPFTLSECPGAVGREVFGDRREMDDEVDVRQEVRLQRVHDETSVHKHMRERLRNPVE